MVRLDRKYKTDDGLEVVALFHYPNNPDHAQIMAHIVGTDGVTFPRDYFIDGSYTHPGNKNKNKQDLVMLPLVVTSHFNVYIHPVDGYRAFGYASAVIAESLRGSDRVATFVHTFTLDE